MEGDILIGLGWLSSKAIMKGSQTTAICFQVIGRDSSSIGFFLRKPLFLPK